jgi:AP-2 complex subunit mu-1
LPFRVHPIVEEIGKTRVEFTVHMKANFDSKLNANSVVLKIPTPLNTTKVTCKAQLGKAKYVPEENVIIWKYVITFFFHLLSSHNKNSRLMMVFLNDVASDLTRIPRMQGQSDATITASADLSATTHRKAWSRPPINIDFQVLMYTSSGLLVRFLKVFEKSNYNSAKWVRYLTKANGSYQIRI